MSNTVQIALLIVVPTGLVVALFRTPNWCFRSLVRHRLWAARDALVRDMIDGRLPKDHPAVRELKKRAEWIIRETARLDMLSFYVWSWVWRRTDPKVREAMRDKLQAKRASWDGLSPEERELLERHKERLFFLSTSSTLVGSWLGIATILRFTGAGIREARKRELHSLDTEVRVTLRTATDRATSDTWLGRCSQEFVRDEPRAHLTSAA